MASQSTVKHGRVSNLPGYGPVDEVQYAGFINVEEETDSNLFFWFFESIAKSSIEETPLVVWLQGGPGASSLYGLFEEIGPYTVTEDLKLEKNYYSWHKHAHLLFVDYPVGTGFSFTNDPDRYVKNDAQGAKDFIECLSRFYDSYPQYRACNLYITGESYAGKYIPAIAHRIIQSDCLPSLAGIAICGAWTHPEAQIPHYANDAFTHGLLSAEERRKAEVMMNEVVELMRKGEMVKSTELWDEVAEFIYERGNNFSPYDVRDFSGQSDDPLPFDEWLTLDEVCKALHVGNRVYNPDNGDAVFQALRGDDMVSSLCYLEEVLNNNTRVLLFNGEFDWITSYNGVETMLENHIEWDQCGEYLKAETVEWNINGATAGYIRNAGPLTHVLVLNAGHMVPGDQPENAFHLIGNFLKPGTS